MAADALDLLDPCFDLDRLTEQLHFLASLNNAASQCADCLIASKQNRTLRSPEVVFQMMADTARLTHTGRRNDYLVEVNCNGIAAGDREMQTRERNRIDALFYQLLRLFIVAIHHIVLEHAGRFHRHRAV